MNEQLCSIEEHLLPLHSINDNFKHLTVEPMASIYDDNNESGQKQSLLSHDTLEEQYNANTFPRSNGEIPAQQFSALSATQIDTKGARMQGVVFVEDAIHYRSIHHKASYSALRLYRWFHSASTKYSVHVATFLILVLAFFESPSSLSWCSDPRRNCTRYIHF